MKQLLVLLALLGLTYGLNAQDRVSQWQGTVVTTSWNANTKVLGAIDNSTANICVYDSSGGAVQVAFQAADTAAASAGASNYATVPPGAVFNFPARAGRTVWLKAVGSSASVIITRY